MAFSIFSYSFKAFVLPSLVCDLLSHSLFGIIPTDSCNDSYIL